MLIALSVISGLACALALYSLLSRLSGAKSLADALKRLASTELERAALAEREREALAARGEFDAKLSRSLNAAILEFKDLLDKAAAVGAKTDREKELILGSSEVLSDILNAFGTMMEGLDKNVCSFQESSASIRSLAKSAEEMKKQADQAAERTEPLVRDVEQGNESVAKTAQAIREIEAASRQVRESLKEIASVAARTNLLAMNAAIEAAHAGDSGAGFAVVAGEVRSLAESSARSAKAVDALMRDMEAKVSRGLELSSNTQESFASIAEGIRQTSQAALELAQGMDTRREETLSVLPELDQLAERLCALQEQYSDRRSAREGIEASLGEIRALSEDIHDAERRLVEQDYVILAMLEETKASIGSGEA